MNEWTLTVKHSTPTVRQACAEQRAEDAAQISVMAWSLFFLVFAFLMGFWARSLW
jgi:hypothetical protein